jgi:hypothetical protein
MGNDAFRQAMKNDVMKSEAMRGDAMKAAAQ